MGRMTDDLWRRTIEVFLLAGENGNDGFLPPLDDMAWTLRLSREQLESNLIELTKYSIVEQRDGRWYVINFVKRQAAISVNDRVSAHRDRKRKQEYYGEETRESELGNDIVTSRYTDLDLDLDKEIDKELDHNPAKPDRLNDLQRMVLSSFNAKRFKNNTQAALVAAWDRYPIENVKSAVTWAATKGFGLGQAIASIDKALPKWNMPKPSGNGQNSKEPISAPRKVYQ